MELLKKHAKKYTELACIILCLLCCIGLGKAYFDGKFNSVETLQTYIAEFGLFAPLMLIVIQAAQVVVPIVPGMLGCIVGAVLFGCMGGFWCNYIGISLGSMIAFLLARHYGQGLIKRLFPDQKYDKISTWAANSKFYTLILFLGMLLPLFPDDYFCYLTGITKMNSSKFAAIIVLGKPWCILAYCLFFSALIS